MNTESPSTRITRHSANFCCLVMLMVGPIAFGSPRMAGDHLLPDVESQAVSRYRTTVNKRLLVTPGNLARCVWLPGNVGTEGSVSLYTDSRSNAGGKRTYWMTVTQASKPIWQSLVNGPVLRPREIPIQRFDVSVPETMALAIAKLWETMLKRTSTTPSNHSLSLDESTELFSATVAGHEVVGRLNKDPKNKNSLEFLDIANSLLEYFNYSPSERPKRALQLRHRALALADRIQSEQ